MLSLERIERPIQAHADVAMVKVIAAVAVIIVVRGERVSGIGGKAKPGSRMGGHASNSLFSGGPYGRSVRSYKCELSGAEK